MPLPKMTKKVTFEECSESAPDLWFEFKRLPSMKYGEVQRLFGGREGQSDENNPKFVQELFSKLIIGWNIPSRNDSTGEEGDVLPLPSVNDGASVAEVPSAFTAFMAKTMMEDARTMGDPNLA